MSNTVTDKSKTKSFIDLVTFEGVKQHPDQEILTFGVKDTIDVEGYKSMGCCRALSDVPEATKHAVIVQQLLNAGCKVVGKTNMHELAYGLTGINEFTGTPYNTNYPGIVPGGSSSGSATAVAAKECDFAIGTDTGGSVRVPAACTGVYGLKPTHGAVSRVGVIPAYSSLDCVGFFGNNIDIIINVLERLNLQSIPIESTAEIQQLQHQLPPIGFISGLAIEKEIDTLIEKRLNELVITKNKGTLVPVTFKEGTLDQVFNAGVNIIAYENYSVFSGILDKVSKDVASRLSHGKNVDEALLAQSELVRTQFTQQVDELLAVTPVIALPTLPILPPTIDEVANGALVLNLSRCVRPFNVTGHPAISIPIGEINGRPVALQLVTSKGKEMLLCKIVKKLMN